VWVRSGVRPEFRYEFSTDFGCKLKLRCEFRHQRPILVISSMSKLMPKISVFRWG